MHLSFQKLFYAIATAIGIFAVLVLAKGILIPIAFAFLTAFILFPVAKKFEYWGANEIMSAFLSILSLILVIGGGIFLFSNQIMELSENLADFKVKILEVFADVSIFINKNLEFLPKQEEGELVLKIKAWLNESASSLLSKTFIGTTGFFFGLITTTIFTFLILIYRHGFVNAFIRFYPTENRKQAFKMFKSVQQVGQQYLFGVMIIILIVGFANSIGLLIIGIDNPFLFGYLAAFLAIIPYVGTIIGAVIPILYGFISYDSIWIPISIGIYFWFVQVIESNFLTPKIVGGKLKINALVSILSIIVGAAVWGVEGMILFLPFTAMLRVVCEEYEELKPIAMLIGEQNNTPKNVNEKIISNWFKIKKWFSKYRTSPSPKKNKRLNK
jgi:predicted PurR-regulated permease PerM